MKRYALFVGIDNYENGITPLKCAVHDAQQLSLRFASCGYESADIKVLLNDAGHCDCIEDELRSICRKMHDGDLLIFYFAGHGREINGEHFLVGPRAHAEKKLFRRGSLAITELITITDKPGIRRLFILDCCRDNLLAGRSMDYVCDTERGIALEKAVASRTGIIPPLILSSCSPGERAYENCREKHGYFTQTLLKAISDKSVRSFSDFRKFIAEDMRVVANQHICWNGNIDSWNNIELFSGWGEKIPENYREIMTKLEYWEGEFARKGSDFSAEMVKIKKLAETADQKNDYFLAAENVQLFSDLAERELRSAEEKLQMQKTLEEAENARMLAEESRQQAEMKLKYKWLDIFRFKEVWLRLLPYLSRGLDSGLKFLEKIRRKYFRPKIVLILFVASGILWWIDYYTSTPYYIAESAGAVFSDDDLTLQKIEQESVAELTELTIPDGVEHIGYDAFSGCIKLRRITIPGSVTSIGSFAFSDCADLSKITIPDSVTSIGSSAFSNCVELRQITIPSGVSEIKSSTFSGCTNLSEINIPHGVVSIGENAFRGCVALKNIIIPKTVKEIGDGAFLGTGLGRVQISEDCDYTGSWNWGDDSFPENCKIEKY